MTENKVPEKIFIIPYNPLLKNMEKFCYSQEANFYHKKNFTDLLQNLLHIPQIKIIIKVVPNKKRKTHTLLFKDTTNSEKEEFQNFSLDKEQNDFLENCYETSNFFEKNKWIDTIFVEKINPTFKIPYQTHLEDFSLEQKNLISNSLKQAVLLENFAEILSNSLQEEILISELKTKEDIRLCVYSITQKKELLLNQNIYPLLGSPIRRLTISKSGLREKIALFENTLETLDLKINEGFAMFHKKPEKTSSHEKLRIKKILKTVFSTTEKDLIR